MLEIDINNYKKLVNEIIDKDDLVPEEAIKEFPHITLAYGFQKTTKPQKIKKYLTNIQQLQLSIIGITSFNNQQYDVIKFSIFEPNNKLTKINKVITDNFKLTTDYFMYKPHMTIAYVKKGLADKYLKGFIRPVKIIPKQYVYQIGDIKTIL